eukprot:gene10456-biopygen241
MTPGQFPIRAGSLSRVSESPPPHERLRRSRKCANFCGGALHRSHGGAFGWGCAPRLAPQSTATACVQRSASARAVPRHPHTQAKWEQGARAVRRCRACCKLRTFTDRDCRPRRSRKPNGMDQRDCCTRSRWQAEFAWCRPRGINCRRPNARTRTDRSSFLHHPTHVFRTNARDDSMGIRPGVML